MLIRVKDLIESNELLAWNWLKTISLYLRLEPAVLSIQIYSVVSVRPVCIFHSPCVRQVACLEPTDHLINLVITGQIQGGWLMKEIFTRFSIVPKNHLQAVKENWATPSWLPWAWELSLLGWNVTWGSWQDMGCEVAQGQSTAQHHLGGETHLVQAEIWAGTSLEERLCSGAVTGVCSDIK